MSKKKFTKSSSQPLPDEQERSRRYADAVVERFLKDYHPGLGDCPRCPFQKLVSMLQESLDLMASDWRMK